MVDELPEGGASLHMTGRKIRHELLGRDLVEVGFKGFKIVP